MKRELESTDGYAGDCWSVDESRKAHRKDKCPVCARSKGFLFFIGTENAVDLIVQCPLCGWRWLIKTHLPGRNGRG